MSDHIRVTRGLGILPSLIRVVRTSTTIVNSAHYNQEVVGPIVVKGFV